jgi:hypothetical protein
MRALVFAAVFLDSSCLYPSYAQDEGNTAPVAAPQTAPAQDKENTAPQQDQRTVSHCVPPQLSMKRPRRSIGAFLFTRVL